MTKPRQYHYGGVPRTALQSTINDTDEVGLMIVIGAAEATNWPTLGPFVARIERGTAREEAFLISGRSGSNLMVAERGYDDTPRVAHTAGSAVFVEHTFDANWPNTVDSILALPTTAGDMVVTNGTEYVRMPVGTNAQVLRADNTQATGIRWGISPVSDLVAAAGDLLYGTGIDNLGRLPIGTDGYPLVSAGGLPAWSRLNGAVILEDTIEGNRISSATIGTDHLIDGSVTAPKIAPGAIGPPQLAPGSRGGVVVMDTDETWIGDTVTPTWLATLTVPGPTPAGTIYEADMFGWLQNGSGGKAWYYFRPSHGGNYTEFLVGATNQAGMYHWHIHMRLIVISTVLYQAFTRYEHTLRDPGDFTDAATMVDDGSLTSPWQFRPSVQWSATRGTVDLTTGPINLGLLVQMASDTSEQYIQCLGAVVTRVG